MQFYKRFQDEVIDDMGTIATHVERSREILGEPFRQIFDEDLVKAHNRLRLDPADREAKVRFVTVYHLVIEGTLGPVTSHFLLDLLRQRELLLGFVDGYSRIARRRAAPHRLRDVVPPRGRRPGRADGRGHPRSAADPPPRCR